MLTRAKHSTTDTRGGGEPAKTLLTPAWNSDAARRWGTSLARQGTSMLHSSGRYVALPAAAAAHCLLAPAEQQQPQIWTRTGECRLHQAEPLKTTQHIGLCASIRPIDSAGRRFCRCQHGGALSWTHSTCGSGCVQTMKWSLGVPGAAARRQRCLLRRSLSLPNINGLRRASSCAICASCPSTCTHSD